MPPDAPALCKVCGYELGSKKEEVKGPNGQGPDDAHFRVQQREDDERRLQCTETGKLSAPVNPGDDGYEEAYAERHDGEPPTVGEGGADQSSEQNRSKQGRREKPTGDVFEFEEEQEQIGVLQDVIVNPHYELGQGQIKEVLSWAEDYNGQMPPDVLEDILKNMSGISKQKAQLVKQRYELKLNKWIQEQHTEEAGPPIGIGRGPMPTTPASNGSQSGPPPSPSPPPDTDDVNDEDETDEDNSSIRSRISGGGSDENPRKKRQMNRIERRTKAADIAAEEMAKQVAPEVARELSRNFGTYFGLPAKVLEAKAERDPDWFLEKTDEIEEKLGISLFDLLEESQAKQERDDQQHEETTSSQPAPDRELDNALDEINTEEQAVESERRQTEPGNPMKAHPDEIKEEESDEVLQQEDESEDPFDGIFGDEAEAQ
jgi:hypothetical protein